MNKTQSWRACLTAVLLLGLAAMSCGPSLSGAAPTPPGSPIPVSSEAAGQLENNVATAVANSNNGQVVLTVTEQQLTSYAVIKLETDPTSPITNTQIYLRSGKVLLYGNITSSSTSLPAAMSLTVTPTASGTVSITIDSLNLGPFPVPSTLRDSLASNLNDIIQRNAGSSSNNFKVTDVSIGEGTMTVTGTITQTQ
jgi:hypothetical protein